MKTILAELKLIDKDTNKSVVSPIAGGLPQFSNKSIEIIIDGESDDEIISKLFVHVLSLYCKLENDEKLSDNLKRRWNIFREKQFNNK